MSDAVLTDALHETTITPPVQRSILQRVVAGVVDRAELANAEISRVGAKHGLADLDAQSRLSDVDVADQVEFFFVGHLVIAFSVLKSCTNSVIPLGVIMMVA